MRREQGSTIVELMLFMSITGLLVMAVIAGFGSAVTGNRVTDTTKSLEGFVEAQYSSVGTGSITQSVDASGKATCVTSRPKAFPGASNDCLVIGKLLRFYPSYSRVEIRSYNVVSNVEPSDTCATPSTLTGVDALKRYCPRVLDMGDPTDTVQPEWSASIAKVGFLNSSDTSYRLVNHIAMLRDPTSELVYVIPFRDVATPGSPYDLRSQIDAAYTNTKGVICINNGGFPNVTSYVSFNGGDGVGSIESGREDDGLEASLRC